MVVTTRTQSGTIEVQKYDPLTLRLRGYESPTSDKSFSSDSRGSRRSKKRFLNSRASRVAKSARLKYERPGPIPQEDCREAKIGFWPSVTIGKSEEAMSEYARACAQVQDWEKILQEHEENHPMAVPQIEITLKQMKKQRDYLQGQEWAHEVGDSQAREDAVQERIQALRAALKISKPPAERDNIQGAIAAYESGQIGYSTKYTLFWAGKAVDQCDSYAEFTNDRMERLDRYAEMYGGHWLWYEEPLAAPQQPMMRCATALRYPAPNGLGLFNINMGFQKEVGLVTRSGPEWPPYVVYARNANIDADTAPDGRVWLYRYGPKLVFHMQLDSGASNPNIYQHDLELLGVHTDDYPAQTITSFNTANGNALMRTYDLKVELVDGRNDSMVDPNDAIHPEFPPLLGAVVGVAMIENGKVYKQETDAMGILRGPGARLSSALPFYAAYSSSTPGNNMVLFGEDRNDVLGFAKMPPARRWLFGAQQDPRGIASHEFFGNPLVTFSHRDGTFVDQDVSKGVSTQTVHPGTIKQQVFINDPANRATGAPGVYQAPSPNYGMDDAAAPILFNDPYFAELQQKNPNIHTDPPPLVRSWNWIDQ